MTFAVLNPLATLVLILHDFSNEQEDTNVHFLLPETLSSLGF